MTNLSPAARVNDAAPEMVRRLGAIVLAVAALIARRFLRDPKFGRLILPLWGWLNRALRRFGRVRVVAAVPVVRKARTTEARTTEARTTMGRVRLPTGRGWLVQALGWEAAGYGSQLAALLAEPEMVALLDAVPAVGRVLRPLGRMLGVTVGEVRVAAPAVRKVRVRKPRVKREPPWRPGPIRPCWVADEKLK